MSLLEEAWEEALEGFVAHRERQVVYLNPKAAQLLGVNREKVLGRPLILALRDHRLEALALHGGERLLEVRDHLLLVRALPGRLYLLDQTEAQRRLKDLEEAAVTLAHELRTPLAGMGPLLEALTPRTVDQHILQLREKLGEDPKAPRFLETVRGVGYRFKEGA